MPNCISFVSLSQGCREHSFERKTSLRCAFSNTASLPAVFTPYLPCCPFLPPPESEREALRSRSFLWHTVRDHAHLHLCNPYLTSSRASRPHRIHAPALYIPSSIHRIKYTLTSSPSPAARSRASTLSSHTLLSACCSTKRPQPRWISDQYSTNQRVTRRPDPHNGLLHLHNRLCLLVTSSASSRYRRILMTTHTRHIHHMLSNRSISESRA
jgi:hypothetical protein